MPFVNKIATAINRCFQVRQPKTIDKGRAGEQLEQIAKQTVARALPGSHYQVTLQSIIVSNATSLSLRNVLPHAQSMVHLPDPKDRKALNHFETQLAIHIKELVKDQAFMNLKPAYRPGFIKELALGYINKFLEIDEASPPIMARLEAEILAITRDSSLSKTNKVARIKELQDQARKIQNNSLATTYDMLNLDYFKALVKAIGPQEAAIFNRLIGFNKDTLVNDGRVSEFWTDLILEAVELEFNPEYGNEKNLDKLLSLLGAHGLIKNSVLLNILKLSIPKLYGLIKAVVDDHVLKFKEKQTEPPAQSASHSISVAGGAAAAAQTQQSVAAMTTTTTMPASITASAVTASDPTLGDVLEATKKDLLNQLRESLIELCGISKMTDPAKQDEMFEAIADVAIKYCIYSLKRKINHFVPSPDQADSAEFSFEQMKAYAPRLDVDRTAIKEDWQKALTKEDLAAESLIVVKTVLRANLKYHLWLVHQIFRDTDINVEPTKTDRLCLARWNQETQTVGTKTWLGYLIAQEKIQSILIDSARSFLLHTINPK